MHFGRGGADAYADKHFLLPLVVLPLALYVAIPWLYRSQSQANSYRPFLTGVTIFLSLVLTTVLLSSTSAG